MGFLPAFPVAALVARRLIRRPNAFWEPVLAVLSFTFFFWCCGGYELLRTTLNS